MCNGVGLLLSLTFGLGQTIHADASAGEGAAGLAALGACAGGDLECSVCDDSRQACSARNNPSDGTHVPRDQESLQVVQQGWSVGRAPSAMTTPLLSMVDGDEAVESCHEEI